MSLEETYEWAKKQRQLWNDNKRNPAYEGIEKLDTELVEGGDHPIVPIKFRGGPFGKFYGEAAEVRGDLIFHIWPGQVPPFFADVMGDAFIKVFRFEDKLSADYVPELEAWAVKVEGQGNNIARDDLVDSLFKELSDALSDAPE